MIGDTGTLGPAERELLLTLARRAVTAAAHGEPHIPGPAPEGLDRPAALFVTVRTAGTLRGCIGSYEQQPSLWRTVAEMAVAAATRDPRFSPISPEELGELSIDISVLSLPRRITSADAVVVGKHGVEIRKGNRRGLLLPQVAVEHNLEAESFLAETCRKAGLSKSAWRDPDTEIHIFEAQIFGDRV